MSEPTCHICGKYGLVRICDPCRRNNPEWATELSRLENINRELVRGHNSMNHSLSVLGQAQVDLEVVEEEVRMIQSVLNAVHDEAIDPMLALIKITRIVFGP